MEEINKKVFIMVLVCTILVNILVGISLNNKISNGKDVTDTNLESAQNLIDSEENVNDVKGYGALLYGTLGAIGTLGTFYLLIIKILIYTMITLPVIFYLISWLIHRKKESKARIIASLVLIAIAMILQLYNIKILGVSCILLLLDVLLLIALIIEIVALVIVAIYYITNIKRIKELIKAYTVDKKIVENN